MLAITIGRGGPDETAMTTVAPGGTGVPGAGLWSTTIPAPAPGRGGAPSKLKPAASSTPRASVSDWPAKSGSVKVSGAGGASPAADRSTVGSGSGAGKPVIGVSASAGSMTRRQIWAGHDPPVTRIGVAGGTIDRSRSGNPTHTAVTRSGV